MTTWTRLRSSEAFRAKVASLEEELGLEKTAYYTMGHVMRRSLAPALAGAGVGAFHGLASGTLDGRNEGKSWKDSLTQGAKGALTSGVIGGAMGGAAGVASEGLAKRTVDFGKGSLHALTGWMPKGGREALGSGSHVIQGQINQAMADKATDPGTLNILKERFGALKAVEDKGLTSLPGLAKGLVAHPIDTLRASKNLVTKGTDGLGKVMLGVGVASSVAPAITEEDATPLQRAGTVAKNLAYMGLTAPLQTPMNQAQGLVEGLVHNVPGGTLNRMAFAPVDEAQRAWRARQAAAGAPTPDMSIERPPARWHGGTPWHGPPVHSALPG